MLHLLRRSLSLLCLGLLLCPGALAQAQPPAFGDLTEACQHVRAAVYGRQTHIAFSLTQAAVAGRSTAQIRDILTDILEGYIDYTIGFNQQADALHITIDGMLRPALNILHAWETGDRSSLTEDEIRCMDIALSIAEDCRRSACSTLEIERAVYDTLCRRLTYYHSQNPPAFGSPEYIRRHSSVGALLDGSTQCLGYSEVFYLIGRLAGLDVQMQYGFTGSASGAKHAWNIVRIDGQNYLADACWGDVDADVFEPATPDYRYFNFGADHVYKGIYAHPEARIAELCETTTWAYTAFGAANGGVIVSTPEEAVDYALARYDAHAPYAHVFIRDAQIPTSAVDALMWPRVKARGITTTWGRMTHSFAGGTYVIFRWVLE